MRALIFISFLSLAGCMPVGPSSVSSETQSLGNVSTTITRIKGPFSDQTCTTTINGSTGTVRTSCD